MYSSTNDIMQFCNSSFNHSAVQEVFRCFFVKICLFIYLFFQFLHIEQSKTKKQRKLKQECFLRIIICILCTL